MHHSVVLDDGDSSLAFLSAAESDLARIAVAHTTAHLLGHALEQTFDGALLLVRTKRNA